MNLGVILIGCIGAGNDVDGDSVSTCAIFANCRDALAHARLMGIPVAYTRWLGSTFFNGGTRYSGWIKGFEPHGSDSIFERKQPS